MAEERGFDQVCLPPIKTAGEHDKIERALNGYFPAENNHSGVVIRYMAWLFSYSAPKKGEESMRYCLLYQQYARTLISATGVESHGELRLGIVAPAATCAGEIRRKSETNSSW